MNCLLTISSHPFEACESKQDFSSALLTDSRFFKQAHSTSKAGRSLIALFIIVLTSLSSPSAARADALALEPEAAARAVMEEFLVAFNARDEARWAKTLLFPHVRISSGDVVVHPTYEGFVAAADLEAFAKRINWQRTVWDSIETVHVAQNKVHLKVRFTRYTPANEVLATYDSLYILQRHAELGWGIRARSSFAP